MVIGASLLSIGSAAADETTPPAASTIVGGTVHFTGQIINAACSVSNNSNNKPVELGQYRSANFKAVGDRSGAKPFTIELEDCDPSVAATAAVAFKGNLDSVDQTILSIGNSSGGVSGVAGGVGIEISDSKGKVLPPDGSSFSNTQALTAGKNVLNFTARYKATLAMVTPGEADADATFTMQYQ